MSLRFRKSFKIAPGFKVNVSKSGFSTTVGKRGLSVNTSSRGTYANVGLPGTGISVRSKISGQATSNTAQMPQQLKIAFNLTDDGKVNLTDEYGNDLPPRYKKIAREQNKELVESWLQEQCDKWNKGIDKALGIHLDTPSPDKKITFEPQEFDKPAPTEPREKPIGLMGQIFQSRRDSIIRSNEQAQKQYKDEKEKWEKELALHDQGQQQRKKFLEKDRLEQSESMELFLEEVLQSIEWPRETIISMEVSKDGKSAMLDIDLPEIEDIPTEQAVVAASGLKINVKKRSDSQRRKEYMTHIHGILFRVIGEAFVALPTVKSVTASGFSQRPNKATGQLEDEYLISIEVKKDNWNKINFRNLDKLDLPTCLVSFQLKRNMTSTGVFKPIKPLDN